MVLLRVGFGELIGDGVGLRPRFMIVATGGRFGLHGGALLTGIMEGGWDCCG